MSLYFHEAHHFDKMPVTSLNDFCGLVGLIESSVNYLRGIRSIHEAQVNVKDKLASRKLEQCGNRQRKQFSSVSHYANGTRNLAFPCTI